MTKITTPTKSYTRHYPKLVELANKQLDKLFWTSTEMKVHLDKQDLLYKLTPEQLHAVKFVLQLFVQYELMVGDFWDEVAKTFPRPEVKLVASVMEMVERAIHSEFYNQINVELGLDSDEHYLAYLEDPILNSRAEWLGNLLKSDDKILGLCIFSMTETALLFSSFSILKSFQTNGYNLIPVIVRGTNQSALDEDHHGVVSAEIINTYFAELGQSLKDDEKRYNKIIEAVEFAYEHECRIVDMAIPSGSLNGVTNDQYKQMVKYRLNVFLNRLNLPARFKVKDTTVVDWYEKNTYSYKVPDFFTKGLNSEYETSFDVYSFGNAWRKKVE